MPFSEWLANCLEKHLYLEAELTRTYHVAANARITC